MNSHVSYWTVRVTAGWAVKRQGSPEWIAVYDRQQDAWAEARRLTGGRAGSKGPEARKPIFRGLAA